MDSRSRGDRSGAACLTHKTNQTRTQDTGVGTRKGKPSNKPNEEPRTHEWDRVNLTHKTNETRTQDKGVGPHKVEPSNKAHKNPRRSGTA